MGNISSREKRQHGSVSVPYAYYECRIPDYFPLVPLHWHNEFELNCIFSGKSELVYGKDRMVTDAGDIVLITPNRLHAIYPHGDSCQVYDTLVFRGEMLGAGKEERGWVSCIEPLINGTREVTVPITKGHGLYGEIRECVEGIFACRKKNTPVADLSMKSGLLRLVCLLEESGGIRVVKEQEDRSMEHVRDALVFINQNFREDICVEQLADMVHLSRSYFMHCFKQATGVSAVEYTIQLRIKNACEMLRNSGRTSVEVAFACGFQNLSNFNRQFKKCVGCTPGQYRRNLRR